MPKTDTRERIVTIASKLFYREGVRAVSLDAIAEKAELTKKTIYYHFKSKDDLIAAYLEQRDQPNLALFQRWFDEAEGPVENKVQAVFQHLADNARHPKWRGCGFLRTAAELANLPGHPAVQRGSEHKQRVEAWLSEVLGEITASPSEAQALARQVVLLLDGAFSTVLIHGDPAYFEAAGTGAREMIIFHRDSNRL